MSINGGHPAPSQIWRSRWSELLSEGLRRDADVRWFTGEHGLLLVCRDLPPADLEALLIEPCFADLLDDLDDRLITFAGPLPSERARALIDVALAPGASDVLARSRSALSAAGSDPEDPSSIAQVDGIITDLRLWFVAGGRAEGRREAEVPIVVSHHARGDVVLLSMRDHPVLGVAPDLVRAPFQRVDASFAEAIEQARAATGARGGVRYLVRSRRTGAPVEAIGGRSVGLGAALALRRLTDPAAAPLDPEWSFTGAVDGGGTVGTLVAADGSHEYGAKLSSLNRGAFVVPAVDRIEVERLADVHANGVRLESVGTVADAERLAARHIQARRAYERALDPGRSVSKVAIIATAALLLVLLAVWLDHHRRATELDGLRAEAAGSEPLTITGRDPDGGARRFQIDRTEVTNRQYRICVLARQCPVPDQVLVEYSLWDESSDLLPVTGVSAADAVAFCRYARGAGWSLPTFSQYGNAVSDGPGSRTAADSGGEVFVDELMPVVGGGNVELDPHRLRGNVAEWTRTQCDGEGCRDLREIVDSSIESLATYGVGFTRVRDGVRIVDDWFSNPAFGLNRLPANAAAPDVGFRCASRS